MRYYRRNRSGSSKTKKIFLRILFVLVSALVITVLAVLLGIWLKQKVASAESLEYAYPEHETAEVPPVSAEDVSMDSPTVHGAGLDVTAYDSEDEIVLSINQLSDYYDTLTLPLTDENGKLVYTSPALCDLMRMPAPESNPNYGLVSSAVTAGQAKNMRICAMITPSDEVMIDAALISELAHLGFDEVVFVPEFGESINYSAANKLRSHLTDCSEETENACSIGVLIPSAYYLRASDAKQIQMIASASDFLAITFESDKTPTTTEAYRTVTSEISSILGSFSVYNMRVILTDSSSEILSAKSKACTDKGINSISLTSPVLPTEMIFSDEYHAETALPVETESVQTVPGETNPYSAGSTTYPSYKDVIPETTEEE